MKYQKPKLTKKQELANMVYVALVNACEPLSKAEICREIGLTYDANNERRVRDIISILAKRKPVIATSDSRGYSLAKSEEDVERAIHLWKELDSRQKELEERGYL